MKFREIFRFEFMYQARRVRAWLYFGVLFVVAVTQLTGDRSLTVGSAVVSGATKLGTVVDLARVETQALAQYTNDGGNHVTIEVRAAPAYTAS